MELPFSSSSSSSRLTGRRTRSRTRRSSRSLRLEMETGTKSKGLSIVAQEGREGRGLDHISNRPNDDADTEDYVQDQYSQKDLPPPNPHSQGWIRSNLSLLLLLSALSFFPSLVSSQLSDVNCPPGLDTKLYNSRQQDPCVMLSAMWGTCSNPPIDNYRLYDLKSNHLSFYPGPLSTAPKDQKFNRCLCTNVIFNLVSACEQVCQGVTKPVDWDDWTESCNSSFTGRDNFPILGLPPAIDVPDSTVLPPWVYIDSRAGAGTWSADNALSNATEEDSSSPSSSSTSGTSSGTPTSTGGGGGGGMSSGSKTGAIVGGIVGGLAVLGFIAVGAFYLFRRHKQRRAQDQFHTEFGVWEDPTGAGGGVANRETSQVKRGVSPFLRVAPSPSPPGQQAPGGSPTPAPMMGSLMGMVSGGNGSGSGGGAYSSQDHSGHLSIGTSGEEVGMLRSYSNSPGTSSGVGGTHSVSPTSGAAGSGFSHLPELQTGATIRRGQRTDQGEGLLGARMNEGGTGRQNEDQETREGLLAGDDLNRPDVYPGFPRYGQTTETGMVDGEAGNAR